MLNHITANKVVWPWVCVRINQITWLRVYYIFIRVSENCICSGTNCICSSIWQKKFTASESHCIVVYRDREIANCTFDRSTDKNRGKILRRSTPDVRTKRGEYEGACSRLCRWQSCLCSHDKRRFACATDLWRTYLMTVHQRLLLARLRFRAFSSRAIQVSYKNLYYPPCFLV